MTGYELEQFCQKQKHCDCMCAKCAAFANYMQDEYGFDQEWTASTTSHDFDEYE